MTMQTLHKRIADTAAVDAANAVDDGHDSIVTRDDWLHCQQILLTIIGALNQIIRRSCEDSTDMHTSMKTRSAPSAAALTASDPDVTILPTSPPCCSMRLATTVGSPVRQSSIRLLCPHAHAAT